MRPAKLRVGVGYPQDRSWFRFGGPSLSPGHPRIQPACAKLSVLSCVSFQSEVTRNRSYYQLTTDATHN